MTLRTEWNAISARIQGVRDATEVFWLGGTASGSDPHAGADGAILPESRLVRAEVEQFVTRHRTELGAAAANAIDRFLKDHAGYFSSEKAAGFPALRRVVPALVAVRSEVNFHLADFSAGALRLTERAFLHLQRSIVADPDCRARWLAAFKKGETACERLGGAHLLLHGIWAFKVHGEGERTDLVMNEPLVDAAEIERAAEALVLTEWKKVGDPGDATVKAKAARGQAARYSSGVLGGIELATYGYVVLVSEHRLAPLADVLESGRLYHHINIAVDPQTPSRDCR
jgi:hypothetical protein